MSPIVIHDIVKASIFVLSVSIPKTIDPTIPVTPTTEAIVLASVKVNPFSSRMLAKNIVTVK